MIYINPRFYNKRYDTTADGNVDKLKSIMKDLTIKEHGESESVLKPVKTGGTVWAGQFGKRKKDKTFKL